MEPQIQPQPQPQPQKTKTIVIIAIIVLAIGIGYAIFVNYRTPAVDQGPKTIVNTTPAVDGVTPAPPGFPSDIPIEETSMTGSATTDYPEFNARQLSLSYFSSKTVAQKYAEYKNYMQQAGYQITEGDPQAPVQAVLGTKSDVNLAVAVSRQGERTFVQVAYLLKSTQ